MDYNSKGAVIIYMNPHIEDTYISEIKAEFEIESDPVIRYDHSEHYKCYLDK